jgi:predicted RNA binding protein YcfA (HicA-like mRNA interferase family)
VNKFPSTKAKQVLVELIRIGWNIKKQSVSHKILFKIGYKDYVFSYHDSEEIGPVMLKKISKYTGLTPEDL